MTRAAISRPRLMRSLTAGFTLLILLAACARTPDSASLQITQDETLRDALQQTCSSPEVPALADVTPWEWDRVSIFGVGATPEEMEREVGSAVLNIRFPYSDTVLLVFQKDGVVLSAVTALPSLPVIAAGGSPRSYSSAARLTPYSDTQTCPRILAEPE